MRSPTEENVSGAKRGFDFLTKRRQPDQSGTREGLLRLKDPYHRARAAFPHAAA